MQCRNTMCNPSVSLISLAKHCGARNGLASGLSLATACGRYSKPPCDCCGTVPSDEEGLLSLRGGPSPVIMISLSVGPVSQGWMCTCKTA
jgi:hypothetical protein